MNECDIRIRQRLPLRKHSVDIYIYIWNKVYSIWVKKCKKNHFIDFFQICTRNQNLLKEHKGQLAPRSHALGTMNSKGIINFSFDIFTAGSSDVTLTQMLQFWTGSDDIPPCDFPNDLTIEFYSYENERDNRLPSASTCSLTLWLPRGIESQDKMQEVLAMAVCGSCGFGKI